MGRGVDGNNIDAKFCAHDANGRLFSVRPPPPSPIGFDDPKSNYSDWKRTAAPIVTMARCRTRRITTTLAETVVDYYFFFHRFVIIITTDFSARSGARRARGFRFVRSTAVRHCVNFCYFSLLDGCLLVGWSFLFTKRVSFMTNELTF